MSINKKIKSITLDDLPRYSETAEIILNYKNINIKNKNKLEIIREFNVEKWGGLLTKFSKMKNLILNQIIDEEIQSNNVIPCFSKSNGLHLTTSFENFEQHIEIYEKYLSQYIDDTNYLVELGAGYGSKIFKLSFMKNLKNLILYAGEYTESGCDLMNLISKNINKHINVGLFDFSCEKTNLDT